VLSTDSQNLQGIVRPNAQIGQISSLNGDVPDPARGAASDQPDSG
jgi:hypothetical protein